MNTTPLPRICFIHVPKTAGSSIKEFFSNLYGDFGFPGFTTLDYDHYSQDEIRDYLCYSGHCYWSDYNRLPSDTKIFTILRNPVSRVVSLYQYWGKVSFDHIVDQTIIEALEIARCSSIYDFITSENPFIKEAIICGQVRQFFRPNFDQDIELVCNTESGRAEIISHVLDTLKRFEAVLTVERLSESLPLLLKKLGLTGVGPLSHVNSSSPRGKIDYDRLTELLLDLSYVDFVIYSAAQRLEKRLLPY